MIQALDPSLGHEIADLAAALEPLRKRQRPGPVDPPLPPDLEARRHALLERHLGRRVEPPAAPTCVIGDSNAMFFTGSEVVRFLRYRRCGWLRPRWINRGLDLLPCFRTFHIGPSTAWMAAAQRSETRAREKIELLIRRDLPPGASLLLSIGEIDCRIHMARRVLAGAAPADLVAATLARFMLLPLWLRDRGFRVGVWGVPQITPRPADDPNAGLPAVGPFSLRRDLTYIYNEALSTACREASIPCACFAGTFHQRAEPMPAVCFSDGVHLSQALMPLALDALTRAGVMEFTPA